VGWDEGSRDRRAAELESDRSTGYGPSMNLCAEVQENTTMRCTPVVNSGRQTDFSRGTAGISILGAICDGKERSHMYVDPTDKRSGCGGLQNSTTCRRQKMYQKQRPILFLLCRPSRSVAQSDCSGLYSLKMAEVPLCF